MVIVKRITKESKGIYLNTSNSTYFLPLWKKYPHFTQPLFNSTYIKCLSISLQKNTRVIISHYNQINSRRDFWLNFILILKI